MGDRETAVRFYNQAFKVIENKTSSVAPTTAWQLFAATCHADPTWGLAWFQYGNNAGDLGHFHTAVGAYRRALQQENDDETRMKILCNLGWRLHETYQIDEALKVTLEARDISERLNAQHPAIWINLAQIYGVFNNSSMAVECAKRAYELGPDQPVNEACYAFALLFARKFNAAFKHFEARFPWRLEQFTQYPYPKWQGERDQTVFVVADQGLGDTLSFSRFLPEVCKRSKYVHAYVQNELMRLFTHAFIGIPNLNLLPWGSQFPIADAWTTFVSLPYALDLSDEEFRNAPNISPPRLSLPTSWMVPDTKLHIGIAWAGSALNDINRHRNIPLQYFLDLYRVPGIQLYSLQVGERREDANAMGAIAMIKPLTPYIADLTDTLALMRDLDLIITCESALGHIANLAGIECWIPYSFYGHDYRIGHRGDDQVWTKHRIFQQGKDADWGPVFGRIVEALQEKVAKQQRRAA